MKRGIAILVSLTVLVTVGYFTVEQMGDPPRDA